MPTSKASIRHSKNNPPSNNGHTQNNGIISFTFDFLDQMEIENLPKSFNSKWTAVLSLQNLRNKWGGTCQRAHRFVCCAKSIITDDVTVWRSADSVTAARDGSWSRQWKWLDRQRDDKWRHHLRFTNSAERMRIRYRHTRPRNYTFTTSIWDFNVFVLFFSVKRKKEASIDIEKFDWSNLTWRHFISSRRVRFKSVNRSNDDALEKKAVLHID